MEITGISMFSVPLGNSTGISLFSVLPSGESFLLRPEFPEFAVNGSKPGSLVFSHFGTLSWADLPPHSILSLLLFHRSHFLPPPASDVPCFQLASLGMGSNPAVKARNLVWANSCMQFTQLLWVRPAWLLDHNGNYPHSFKQLMKQPRTHHTQCLEDSGPSRRVTLCRVTASGFGKSAGTDSL